MLIYYLMNAPLTQVVEYFHGKEKVVRASRARGTNFYLYNFLFRKTLIITMIKKAIRGKYISLEKIISKNEGGVVLASIIFSRPLPIETIINN